MKKILSSIKTWFENFTSNKLMLIFAIGAITLYFIGFFPNNSEYLDIILSELNSIFIGGIFIIIIVDKVTELNIQREKKTALDIMQKSILSLINMIVREFHYKIISLPEFYDNDTLKELREYFNKYIDEEDKTKKDEYFLDYVFELTKNLEDNITMVIPSLCEDDEIHFYESIKLFSDSTKEYLNAYRNLWVERFLTFAGDESEKINSIIDLDSKIFYFECHALRYLRLKPLSDEEFNNLTEEGKEEVESNMLSLEETNKLNKRDIIIRKETIANDLSQIILSILKLVNILYEDMEY